MIFPQLIHLLQDILAAYGFGCYINIGVQVLWVHTFSAHVDKWLGKQLLII